MHKHQHSSALSGGSVTLIVLSGLVCLLFIAAYVWAYARVIRRAGYSGWWILIGLVPILNIVYFFLFAFKEWPAQRELRQLREWAAHANGPDVPPRPYR